MRARDWGIAKLKELGFKNVHAEEFAKPSWQRGDESAEVLAPFPQKLAVIGLGHSVPTPPDGIEGEIIVFRSLDALKSAAPDACKGKIVVVNQPMTRTENGLGYGLGVAARSGQSEAARHGAIAYLTRSISTGTGRAPHTGDTHYDAGVTRIPAAALGVPDADLLEHMAARGPVRIRLKLQSTLHPETLAWNVSGEITGSAAPNEVLVVGGHLDSWDPGTGAIDDGAGVAITTAAAHLIGELPRHPRRTIRVVMWGSEETGGAGEAYLAAHKGELSSIVIASESDFGADRAYSLELPPGTASNPELKPLGAILSPIRVMVSPLPILDAGTDVEDIEGAGVPVFAINQDGTRYFDYHHSADDTLAIVDPEQLKQNVAAWAATLYMLANSDVDFRAKPAAASAKQ
jgi:hypothetical protein